MGQPEDCSAAPVRHVIVPKAAHSCGRQGVSLRVLAGRRKVHMTDGTSEVRDVARGAWCCWVCALSAVGRLTAAGPQAAIHWKNHTSDESGIRAGEEGDHVGDLLWLGGAS
jgi:hypothetical protein